MKVKKTLLAIVVFALAATVITGVVMATGHQKEEPQTQKKTSRLVTDIPSDEYLDEKTKLKLAASREKVISTLSSELEGIEQWKMINFLDIDIEFSNRLDKAERLSVSRAIINVDKNHLKVGDFMPTLLLNDEQDQGYFVWERGNGNVVYVKMEKSKRDQTWSLGEGKEIEVSP